MAFESTPRRRPGAPGTLLGQIDVELRERIEEAVDFVGLELLVAARRAAGRPAPVADSARDREEFTVMVRAFLQRLERDLGSTPPPPAAVEDLVGTQVALAKALPDYWQRFDEVRLAYAAEQPASGSERGGLLRRIFSR